MALSNPRSLFGIHSALFYRLSNGKPYGPILKVLGSGGVNISSDFEDLTGGSERFIIASEPTLINSDVTIVTRDYRDYLYELFTGASVTANVAEATGNVSTLVNVEGTSVLDATTGIASVAALSGSEANLKFGKVIVEATGADTVNILYSSDIDFARGTDGEYQSDDLEVLAADLTIPGTGGTVDATDFGLQFTGGSGAIALTIGDTAEFYVRNINTGSSVISIGSSTTSFPEFGCILYAQKRGSDEMFEIELFRCIGSGLPHEFEEKTFAEAEITIKALKDFSKDKVMEIRAIKNN